MNFLDLKDIAEAHFELVNPSSPEKVLAFGRRLRLQPGEHVIDYGCGYAEPLVLLAEAFGIRGVGIEKRPKACARARAKVAARGLSDRLEIVCGDGAAFDAPAGGFDVALVLGASFIWGGFRPTLEAVRAVIKPDGRVGIGEPYWLHDNPPAAYATAEPHFHHEHELLAMARETGYELAGIVRASVDDWDRYESDNWDGLLRWLRANPTHPERQAVIDHLLETQVEYVRYVRGSLGWAMYALERRM